MKIKLLLSFLILSIFTNAQADIYGGKSSKFIEVLKHPTQKDIRSFRLCTRSKIESECIDGKLLGYRVYNIRELKSERTQEQWEFVASIAATAVITVAAGWATGAAAAALIPASYTTITGGVVILYPETIGLLAWGAAGTAMVGVATAINFITKLAPAEQGRQQYVLRNAIIDDQNVFLKNKDDSDMEEIAERLTTVLDKI